MSKLEYNVYNDKSFIVHGDREKYAQVIKNIGGRWNSKLKPSAGWTVPKTREADLKKLVAQFSGTVPAVALSPKSSQVEVPEQSHSDDELDQIEKHIKSRKDQNKYHRAVSDSDVSEDSLDVRIRNKAPPAASPVHKMEEDLVAKKKEEERLRFEKEKEQFQRKANGVHHDDKPNERREDKHRHEKYDRRHHVEKREDKHARKHKSRHESSSDEDSDVESSPPRREEKHKREKKNYAKNPKKFKELYSPSSSSSSESSSVSESESDVSSSSSDGFPLPDSPKPKKKNYEELMNTIKKLEKKVKDKKKRR